MSLVSQFKKIFDTTKSPEIYFAPGRINLIGEHTDYNSGYVFPASITFGTYALAVKRSDRKLRFFSLNIPETDIIECDLDHVEYDKKHEWANYPKGMIFYLKERGLPIDHGLDILFYGNIPYGAGLSSSASIEMVTGVLLKDMFQLNISQTDLIQLGKQTENEYIGVNSGIMDQFAVGMGKKSHAILLNTYNLFYDYAPLQLEKHVILIMNTNKQRALSESKYNERRKECERALKHLQEKLSIENLSQLTVKQFEQHKHLITDKTIQKRAKHVIYENDRTLRAFEKLKNYDLHAFGRLLNESHQSLAKDYEVTGKELDTIVEAAWDQKGVLGGRMTGAGFGGCAIALVEKNMLDSVINNIQHIYTNVIGYEATFYTATIGHGAHKLTQTDIHLEKGVEN